MFPFTVKTLQAIAFFLLSIIPAVLLQACYPGFLTMIGGNIFFVLAFAGTVYYFEISPDVSPVLNNILSRFRSR
jgi:hypothetical protein